MTKDLLLIIGSLAQSVLFVVLCWPTTGNVGKWRRRLIFVGKAMLAALMGFVIGFLMSLAGLSMIGVRVAVVVLLGVFGWMLRKNLRRYTEVPDLGLGFWMGWLFAEASVSVFVSWIFPTNNPLIVVNEATRDFLRTEMVMPMGIGPVEIGMVLSLVLPIIAMVCWMWLFLRQRFMNVMTMGGIAAIMLVFGLPLAFKLVGDLTSAGTGGNMFISRLGMQILSAIAMVVVTPTLARLFRKYGRRLLMPGVYRMEQDVAMAIERVFDESSDKSRSISEVLACMKISSFAFYERVSRDGFSCVIARNWATDVPETLTTSELLRSRLGQSHELVDFEQLPYCHKSFFVSFELWRMHLKTHAALMLPICLGSSVRGLLFVRAENVVAKNGGDTVPTASSLVDSINSFGLSAVTPR